MKKILITILILSIAIFCLSVNVFADEAVSENYVETENEYIVYTDEQYGKVITGVYDGTLENKKILFGCNIEVTTDFVMTQPCDITVDLNGYTFKNYKVYNKSGDFDFQHSDAILRISNGYIDSSFCVFIFRSQGQLYAENLTVSSNDECIYRYGDFHKAIISLKNCKMDARGNYPSISLCGNCGGNSNGSLYMIEGGEYAGLNIYCATEGSYIRDCKVYEQRFVIDAWHRHGGNNNDEPLKLEVRNVNVEHGEIYLNDVAVEPKLYDCYFTTINLSNKKDAFIVSYTSPTCEKAGTMTTYKNLTEIVVDEQYPIENPALGHTLDLENPQNIVYENFMRTGRYITSCSKCGTVGLEEKEGTAPALFNSRGYSIPLDGSCEFYIDISVNFDAIERYEAVTKKSLTYGILAVSEKNLGTNDVFDKDGNAVNGAIKAEINRVYASLELRIKGFKTDSQKLAKIAIGVYVCETVDNTSEYSFSQYGAPLETQKYAYISYDDVLRQGDR